MSETKKKLEDKLIAAINYKPRNLKEVTVASGKSDKMPKPRSNARPYTVLQKAKERAASGLGRNPHYDAFMLDNSDCHWTVWQYIVEVVKERWPAWEERVVHNLKVEKLQSAEYSGIITDTYITDQTASRRVNHYVDDYLGLVFKPGDRWPEYEEVSNFKKAVESLDDKTTVLDLYRPKSSPNCFNRSLENIVVYSNATGVFTEELNYYFDFVLTKVLRFDDTEERKEWVKFKHKLFAASKEYSSNYLDPEGTIREKIREVRTVILDRFYSLKNKNKEVFEKHALAAVAAYRRTEDRFQQFQWTCRPANFAYLFSHFEVDRKKDWPELMQCFVDNIDSCWVFGVSELFHSKEIITSDFGKLVVKKILSEISYLHAEFAERMGQDRWSVRHGVENWYEVVSRPLAAFILATGKRIEWLEDLILSYELETICNNYVEAIKEAKRTSVYIEGV